MKILLFGGTTEGRVLAQELTQRGHQVTVSVATALGAEELQGIPCTIWQGRMEEPEMEARIRAFDLVIDATHPYAEVVSENIRKACDMANVPLRRVLRAAGADVVRGAIADATDAGDIPTAQSSNGNANTVRVDSCRAAAEYLQDRPGNVLVATGSKALRDYGSLAAERVFPRVLPTHEALEICEEMGIPHRNILALQGPFTREMNVAMLRQYDIAWLVTKDGGKAGGFEEKWQAAQETGAQLILVGRPSNSGVSMEQLLEELV